MNPHDEPFELELAALRPQPVSPELRQRIADRLAGAPARVNDRRRIAAWSSLIAASFAIAGFLWQHIHEPPPEHATGTSSSPSTSSYDGPGPTLLAFRRAVARSPDDLEGFLDGQGRTVAGSRQSVPQFQILIRSTATFPDFLKDE